MPAFNSEAARDIHSQLSALITNPSEKSSSLREMSALLEANQDALKIVDAEGCTLLHQAMLYIIYPTNLEMAAALVFGGVDLDSPEDMDNTSLLILLLNKSERKVHIQCEMVKLLIKAGIQIDQQNEKNITAGDYLDLTLSACDQAQQILRACPQIGRDLKNSGETGRREDLKNR
jgi:ankyrin repeat protein